MMINTANWLGELMWTFVYSNVLKKRVLMFISRSPIIFKYFPLGLVRNLRLTT